LKTQTISITVGATREEVFKWLAESRHLPLWLNSFCREIEEVSTGYRATTCAGEVFLAVKSDAITGVVDLLVGAQLDEMSAIPLRVLRRPHGSAILLTFFQETSMPAEIYRTMLAALAADMRGLARRFGGGELHLDGEVAPAFYPGMVTSKFYETWDFYTSMLNFRTINECDAYVQLQHASGAQLGILRQETDGVPAELISCVEGRGFWLSVHVPDADAEHERLDEHGVDIVETPADRPWGLRDFTVRDPNGVLVRVAHVIPAFVEEDSLLAT
jgi:catechol 2,3-dioxygenase-like lactoylglutathione lyase family enzyme